MAPVHSRYYAADSRVSHLEALSKFGRLNASRIQRANGQHSFLREFGLAVTLTEMDGRRDKSPMLMAIQKIASVGIPSQIARSIVLVIAIVVASFQTSRPWSMKRQQHQRVYARSATSHAVAQHNRESADLVRTWRQNAGFRSLSVDNTAHSAEAAHLVQMLIPGDCHRAPFFAIVVGDHRATPIARWFRSALAVSAAGALRHYSVTT